VPLPGADPVAGGGGPIAEHWVAVSRHR
jgi:hypothetical protein